jgi:succinate dehydrogenase flavin-adding protein (antitoxin of CptAB toxin-antitoxin module)
MSDLPFDLDEVPKEENSFLDKKKRKNGNKKGKRHERSLCKDLEAILGDSFRRTPMSGAFMGGVNWLRNGNLNQGAIDTLAGDIICPEYFKFSIESKNYQDVPKVYNLLDSNDLHLDKWIKQAETDASKSKKHFLLMFRVTEYRQSYVCLSLDNFKTYCSNRKLEMPESYLVHKTKYVIIGKDVFFTNYLSKYKLVEDEFYSSSI